MTEKTLELTDIIEPNYAYNCKQLNDALDIAGISIPYRTLRYYMANILEGYKIGGKWFTTGQKIIDIFLEQKGKNGNFDNNDKNGKV
jgi:hypothetical protein